MSVTLSCDHRAVDGARDPRRALVRGTDLGDRAELAGDPGLEAVALAADTADNNVITQRAEKVRALLAGGTNLPDALRIMDDTGELRWRIANALEYGSRGQIPLPGRHRLVTIDQSH